MHVFDGSLKEGEWCKDGGTNKRGWMKRVSGQEERSWEKERWMKMWKENGEINLGDKNYKLKLITGFVFGYFF